MKIGELARRTLHTAETIRYYERISSRLMSSVRQCLMNSSLPTWTSP